MVGGTETIRNKYKHALIVRSLTLKTETTRTMYNMPISTQQISFRCSQKGYTSFGRHAYHSRLAAVDLCPTSIPGAGFSRSRSPSPLWPLHSLRQEAGRAFEDSQTPVHALQFARLELIARTAISCDSDLKRSRYVLTILRSNAPYDSHLSEKLLTVLKCGV